MTHRPYLGLDIGGTKCAAILGDADGKVIDRAQWPSQANRGPEAMIADAVRHAQNLMARHGGVRAAGVSIGGPLDQDAGVIHEPPNLPGWRDVPLKAVLERELSLPVRVEHDAAACAMAEHRWGAAKGATRAAYLTCGTGFGVGLVFDGRPYHGARGRSIEIGHVRYRDDGPTAFGKQGCFEAFAAGSSLPRLAAWKFPHRWRDAPPEGATLAELAAQGDADAQAVIELNATAVGDACALLADLLFLDVITLGSLARYLGEEWLNSVRRRFATQALPAATEACRVVPAGLGDRLQDLSALVVAIEAEKPSSMS